MQPIYKEKGKQQPASTTADNNANAAAKITAEITAKTTAETTTKTAAKTPSTTATSQTIPNGEDNEQATPSSATIGVRSLILNPPGTDIHNASQLLTKDELYKLIQSHKLGAGAKSKQGKKPDYVNVIQSALKASNTTPNPVLVREIHELVKLKKGSRKAGNA